MGILSLAILNHMKKWRAGERYAGAAAISITILHETWKVIGFPGGRQWASWWEHEAVYGVLMWSATCMFGWFYKASRGE